LALVQFNFNLIIIKIIVTIAKLKIL